MFMPQPGFFVVFLARYRNQTSQAESYYRHAAQLVPSNGESGIPFRFIILKEDLGCCFSCVAVGNLGFYINLPPQIPKAIMQQSLNCW